MADTATLSPEFQIAIPEAIRIAQKWKVGQEFAFLPRDGSVVIVPVPTIDELTGIAEGADTGNYRDRNDRY
ncbi:MAG: AbrB/MazE/SpoVT family DNA-binding domain-containing protein [Rhizobiaceae bacterium]|nr:AbrB/MazE/SpoVT family DNA-binding domain-containing protein [Rhizobiaceae bacterium]